MRRLYIILLFHLVVVVGASSSKAGDREVSMIYVNEGPVRVPLCPEGCELRLYAMPKGIHPHPERKSTWLELFQPSGLTFSKGGFFLYYVPTHTLLMATTAEDHNLISEIKDYRAKPPQTLP